MESCYKYLHSYERIGCLTSVGENTHHPSVDAVLRNYKSAARIHISRIDADPHVDAVF